MKKPTGMPRALVLALAPLLLVCGCQQDMQAAEEGAATAAKKVLIAGTASEFKAKVVEGIVSRLGTKDYYLRIIGLDALEKEDAGSFGAVLLVNACMAGKMDGRVTRFLSKNPSNPKVIVFTSRGGEGKPIDLAAGVRVDAVSSVSPAGDAGKKADELAALIRARFATP